MIGMQIWDAKMCNPDSHVYLKRDYDERIALFLDAREHPEKHEELIRKFRYSGVPFEFETIHWRDFLFKEILGD